MRYYRFAGCAVNDIGRATFALHELAPRNSWTWHSSTIGNGLLYWAVFVPAFEVG